MLRFSAFRKMAKYYFADKAEQCDDLFDYGKCHLGEDRWLTHLFMIGAKERYQIQLCTGAFCKTEAVQTYQSLLKQRRRWFLGFITNEVCMLTDIRLWKRYPLLCIVRFMQNTIRTTALLFFIMAISIITTSNKVKNLPVGFIAVSLGLNWLLMLYFGAKLRRFKIWLYPVMFIINPFFNWVYMVYGIFTAGQRTWGGPRADAGSADTNITPQQAIEHAEATGDDLNVVPETFKPSAEARHPDKNLAVLPLQPSDHLEGRFAPAERLPGGWYMQGNDSGLTLPNMLPRNPNAPRIPLHPRDSFDSFITSASANNSVYMPRRVESIMGEEDRRKYFFAQQAQREPAGAYMTANHGHVYDLGDEPDKGGWAESVDSLGYDAPHQNNNHDSLLRPDLQPRTSSYNAVTPTDSRSPNFGPAHPTGLPTQTASNQYNEPTLPESSLVPEHPSSASNQTRTARSPLGRTALSRSNTGEEPGIELDQRSRQQEALALMADRERDGRSASRSRGRSTHGRSDSHDRRQRTKLSKPRPTR